MYAALVLSLLLFAGETAPLSTEPATAAAEPGAAAPVETASTPKADGSRMVCRSETKANSRLTTKICKTADEWELRTEEARKALGDMQGRPITSLCKPTGCV